MLIQPFTIKPLNKHYEGAYDESQIEWRKVAAVDKVDNLERLLGSRRVETVLEVGCGTGSVLAEIAARKIGRQHVGVDVADPRAHAHPGASGLDLRTYDGQKLDFDDRTFDLVVATHVVEHVPNPRQFLTELARVSRQFVYVEVPCEMRARAPRAKLQSALDIGHINGYSPEYFLILLQTTGLSVLEIELFDHSAGVHKFHSSRLKSLVNMAIRRAFLRISPLLAARLFCYHCGALAAPAQQSTGNT
jgi:predicted TPR repeat methyltransferase